jgi:mannose/fructose/N-acetylgalactosamine-specific phosphotransferase system component IIC
MQRLNFQQDLRDQLMNDGAFQQVSMLPVIAAGAEIAAEVAIPAIIRAAPVIAEYMGANMAREQIAAAIADVAGHAAALWYLNNLSNDAYFEAAMDNYEEEDDDCSYWSGRC